VSVIGLGSETDADAEFLKDIALRGKGRIQFAATADDLPRLFAQEAITVARSSFINEPTPARTLADMILLGDLPASPFPIVDGYNLTYLRPGATMGVVTTDDYQAPLLAFWHRGLGRVASLTAEVDGEHSSRLNAWSGFAAFGAGVARWLLGGDPPVGAQASLDRQGGQAIVRVDLDPARSRGTPGEVRTATATIVSPNVTDPAQQLALAWVGADTLEARFPIQKPGMYLGAVRLGTGEVLPLAPLTLPYSPEFEPRVDPLEGRNTLVQLARDSGGIERTEWDDVFAGRLRHRQIRELVWPLALLLLALHVAEIAGRRLHLFTAAQEWLRTRLRLRLRWPSLRWLSLRRPSLRRTAAGGAARPSQTPAGAEPERVVPDLTRPDQAKPAVSALSRAKGKARDRLER
jgi:hypothetical protein